MEKPERFDAAAELERRLLTADLEKKKNTLTMIGAVESRQVRSSQGTKSTLPPMGLERGKSQRQEAIEQVDTSLKPTMIVSGHPVRRGDYGQNGAYKVPGGVCFTVHSRGATGVTLCLFHRHQQGEPYVKIPFPKNFQVGHTYSMIVFGLDIEDFEYTYRFDGPYDPSRGLYFNKNKDVLDPYARAVAGQSIWGEPLGVQGQYRGRVVRESFNWGNSDFPNVSMEDSIIYELHVRSFTKDASSGVQFPGTFAGIIEKIPYLKELGITAVELMPIMEFDETLNSRVVDGKKLLEAWGYNTVAFFAPNTAFAASKEYNYEGYELKNLIRILHENGIEVIMDVVFNHTAEGNENGPVISFKGIDNNVYYIMTPDGYYYNFSGCGNTLNCNHPAVRDFIKECLQHWVKTYHVDGFRFDLASILGRANDGSPMENPPLLESLANDYLIGKSKLIAEAWDAGGLYQVGSFPAYRRWAEWNGAYRDCLREFLKGNYWNAPEAARRLTGSLDIYNKSSRYAGHTSSVNFLTCHDGFTLRDLYSYNGKHNWDNGWDNTDGSDDNHSWNCGIEGETNDPDVLKLREQMMRNAIAVLMMSRGTPMILAGDEFGNTQFGNNNAYCQDGPISWLDWSQLEKHQDYFEFYKAMIALRKQHPVISHDFPGTAIGLPKVLVCSGDPKNPYVNEGSSLLCVLFSGRKNIGSLDDAVYVVINSYWEEQEFSLPLLPPRYSWEKKVDTTLKPYTGEMGLYRAGSGKLKAAPRSVQVYTLRIY